MACVDLVCLSSCGVLARNTAPAPPRMQQGPSASRAQAAGASASSRMMQLGRASACTQPGRPSQQQQHRPARHAHPLPGPSGGGLSLQLEDCQMLEPRRVTGARWSEVPTYAQRDAMRRRLAVGLQVGAVGSSASNEIYSNLAVCLYFWLARCLHPHLPTIELTCRGPPNR